MENYNIPNEYDYSNGSIAYNDVVYNLYNYIKQLVKNPNLMSNATFDAFYLFLENPCRNSKGENQLHHVSMSFERWLRENEIELLQLHQSLINNIVKHITFSNWARFVYNTSHHQESFRHTNDIFSVDTRDPYEI